MISEALNAAATILFTLAPFAAAFFLALAAALHPSFRQFIDSLTGDQRRHTDASSRGTRSRKCADANRPAASGRTPSGRSASPMTYRDGRPYRPNRSCKHTD